MYLDNIFVWCWFWQIKSGSLFKETIQDSIGCSELLVMDYIYIFLNVSKMAIYCSFDIDQSIFVVQRLNIIINFFFGAGFTIKSREMTGKSWLICCLQV